MSLGVETAVCFLCLLVSMRILLECILQASCCVYLSLCVSAAVFTMLSSFVCLHFVPLGSRELTDHLLPLWGADAGAAYVPLLVCGPSVSPPVETQGAASSPEGVSSLPWPEKEALLPDDLLSEILRSGIVRIAGVGRGAEGGFKRPQKGIAGDFTTDTPTGRPRLSLHLISFFCLLSRCLRCCLYRRDGYWETGIEGWGLVGLAVSLERIPLHRDHQARTCSRQGLVL